MEELAKSVAHYMDMVEGPAEAEEDNDMHAAPTGTTAEEDAAVEEGGRGGRRGGR